MLPELFEMDDYSSCMKNNNLYCKVRAKMTDFKNDTIKQHVLNLTQNLNLFDRSILERSLCISKPRQYDERYIKEQSENIINQRLKDTQITTTVYHIKCTDGSIPITLYDFFILLVFLIYAVFIIFATFNEKRNRNQKEKSSFQRIVSEFSIIYNWKRKTNVNKNDNYQKLLSMQGLKLFTMVLVIVFHTAATYVYIYIANPESFEEASGTPQAVYTNTFNMHLVLNFFVLSSWLLTIQVDGVVKKVGYISLKHVGIIILNRYFRLMTTAGFVIIFFSTSWAIKMFSGPLNFDIVQQTQNMCRKNFYYDLFFLQNFLSHVEMCNPVSWYLATDFQLYVLNTLLLYIWYKFDFKVIKLFSIVFALSLVVYASILYVYDSNGLYLMEMQNAKRVATGPTSPIILHITYMSPYSVFPGSLVGVMFGIFYITNKHKTIKYYAQLSKLCNMLFFGLPCLVFIILNLKFQRFTAAVVGSMMKPLYCLGIAIGIFGMSHKLGGKVKKCLEHKYVVLLGNFSYCSYICHWLFMMGRHSVSPPFLNVTTVVTDIISLLTKAVIFGTIISLTVEEPGLSMQKRLLPQITTYEKREEKKK